MTEHAPPPQSDAARATARESLRDALRRARVDDAERVGAQTQNLEMERLRLELLQVALAPLIAQLPDDDLFDIGLTSGVKPRLFLDMIGFIEMAGEGRTYRLVQDRRFGRVVLTETADVERMVDAVTDYVARRLIEREKAFASLEDGTRPPPLPRAAGLASDVSAGPRATALQNLGVGIALAVDILGAIAFFTLIALGAWLVLTRLLG